MPPVLLKGGLGWEEGAKLAGQGRALLRAVLREALLGLLIIVLLGVAVLLITETVNTGDSSEQR